MGLFNRNPSRDENDNLVPPPYAAPRPIVAAATRLHITDQAEIESLKKRRQISGWQKQAWEYYDLVGELKFAANLIGSVISRIRIYSAYVLDENMAPAHITEIKDLDKDIVAAATGALRLLSTNTGGTSGFLRDMAINLFITGECYLVQQPAMIGKPGSEIWQIVSTDELIQETSTTNPKEAKVALKPRRNAQPNEYIRLPGHAFVGRIWKQHPRYSDEADSSVKSVLELLDELLLLNKDARATIKSKLNAGLLAIPDDFSSVTEADGSLEGEEYEDVAPLADSETDSFEEELEQALLTPISDESSASSVVPVIIRAPAESINSIRYIQINRAFDAMHDKRVERVMERILGGLDIPKDVVKGIADAKYANATVVEETLLKSHIEPLMLQIVDALTIIFLRPVLRSQGFSEEQIKQIVVWYDPSAITTKPSKAEAANIGFENKVISAKAWRRANGFHEGDAPTQIEIGQRLAVERGLLSEPVTEALLRTLIPELLQQVQEEQLAQAQDTPQVLEKINGDTVPDQNVPSTNTSAQEPPVELIEP